MDFSGIQTVTKQYNWRGEHVAYRTAGSTIPCDDRNNDYREIRERIANGQCNEVEPRITTATRVYTSERALTGYDTNFGFIPHDASNKLYELLEASAEAGECVIKDPKAADAGDEKIDALIFCAVLDRGWQHLAGPLTRQFEYRPRGHAAPIKLNVRIRNIPATPEDVLPHVFGAMGVEAPSLVPIRFKALQAGMIEIEVAVALLQKLFRNERARVRKWIEPFFADFLPSITRGPLASGPTAQELIG